MPLIEALGGRREVEAGRGREALADRGPASRDWPCRAQVHGSEGVGGARGDRDDRLPEADARELHLHGAVGQQARLGRHRRGGIEAVHRAPGHDQGVRARRDEHAAARRGIEVGEEGGHPGRTREQAGEAALVGRGVGAAERDVPVGVHEGGRLRAAIEGERERDRSLEAVVVREGDAGAQVGSEGRIGARDVVASGPVPLEAHALARQGEGIRADDEAPVVLEHRDVADVAGRRGPDVEGRHPALEGGHAVRPQVLARVAFVGAEAAVFLDRSGGVDGRRVCDRGQRRRARICNGGRRGRRGRSGRGSAACGPATSGRGEGDHQQDARRAQHLHHSSPRQGTAVGGPSGALRMTAGSSRAYGFSRPSGPSRSSRLLAM